MKITLSNGRDGHREVKYDYLVFPGGEPHIKLEEIPSTTYNPEMTNVTINIRIQSFMDIGKLYVTVDALKRMGYKQIHLSIGYFPGARQDRVANKGESLTSKVYADIINSMNFSSVKILDAHSDVSTALLNNCTNMSNLTLAFQAYNVLLDVNKSKNDFVIIAPDAGSLKKIFGVAKELYNTDVAIFHKSRDTKTGELSGFKLLDGEVKDKECIIIDDICDGGGTFIGIAKELLKHGARKVHLVVTHGIFSKPLKELKRYFNSIHTSNSWRNEFDWERVAREKNATDIVKIYKILNL